MRKSGAKTWRRILPGLLIVVSAAACGDSTVVLDRPDVGLTPGGDASVPALSLSPEALPAGRLGLAYDQILEGAGGVAPYLFALESGALPAGLELLDGRIAGTPSEAGAFAFELRVTDSATPPATGLFARTLAVHAEELVITTALLPEASLGVAYSVQLESQGGWTPVSWALDAQAQLPDGLSLDAAGRISGTPSATGSFAFKVLAQDSLGASASAELSLQVVAGSAVVIDTASLPDGKVGEAYSQALAASGGTAPYAWSVAGGALPPGLSLAGALLEGRPEAAGTFTFTLLAVDAASPGQSASAGYTVRIAPREGGTLVIANTSLPDGVVGAPYAAQLAAGGGVAPYSFRLASGILSPGVSLLPSGELGGVPTTAGTSLFTVEVADSSSPPQLATASLGLTVLATSGSLRVTNSSLPGGTLGVGYLVALGAAGGVAPYAWSLASGQLPEGVSLSGDGTLSGTPAAQGSFTFAVEVRDASSPAQSAQKQFTVPVGTGPLSITTVALPKGVVGRAYSAKLEASGGAAPYAWMLAEAALPAGLALDAATGTISGTPTAPGQHSLTVRVADSSQPQKIAEQSLAVTITASLPGVLITTAGLPDGVTGLFYSQTLTASGGTPPYSWSLAAGSLPAGLALDPGGVLSGTPSAAGGANFSLRVQDSATPRDQAVGAFTLDIRAPLAITPAALPAGNVGVAYAASLAASGGAAPYRFALLSGSLPPGLTLGEAGAISGTPAAEGTFGFSVQVSDASNPAQATSASLAIAVASDLAISTPSLPAGSVGVPYSSVAAAAGGTPPYTWSVSAGDLPPGLALEAASGRIAGTPSAEGSFAFTLRVEDASAPVRSATRALSIDISSESAVVLLTTSVPGAVVGASYSTALSAAGGTTPYVWSIAAGSLPAGLSLDAATGVIAGSPSQPGSSSFTVRVADASTPQQAATRELAIAVVAKLGVSTASLPAGVTGGGYSAQLTATGGTSPYAWSITGGSLPPGVSLDALSGALSGTPTSAGSFGFTVQARDASSPQQTASATLTIAVAAALSITTSGLPDAVVGAAYSANLAAAGGLPPYTWAMSSGALPPGISLAANGQLSGTPTGAGSFSFGVTVSDSSSPKQSASKTLTLTVRSSGALTLVTTALPGGVTGEAYGAILEASGGTTPYAWAVSAGSLPPGISLDPSSGALSGTPTSTGGFAFTIQVADASSPRQTASRALTLTVSAPLAVVTSSLPGGVVGVAYSAALSAAGGQAPYAWSITAGNLPAGLSLDAATGVISGTPTSAANRTLTVQVLDASSPAQQASASLALVITEPLRVSTANLPRATLGAPYAASLQAAGGTAPYTWFISSGSLPSGLQLESGTGAISGTPTAAGTWAFTAVVVDGSNPAQAASADLSVVVSATLTVVTASLPDGLVGAAYSVALQAAGGLAPYSWALVGAGSLPPGLTLSAAGTISGVPTAAGSSTFNVQVSDASTPTQRANKQLSIETIVAGSLTVTTAAVADAVQGVAYSASLSAEGGTAPYRWAIASGALPPGVVLEEATGALGGTPTAAGSYSFVARVDDASTPSQSASRALTLVVAEPLAVSTASLPGAVSGQPYQASLTATGGRAPYFWSIVSGQLPQGLTLDAATGALSGTPVVQGTSSFTVGVTDASQPAQTASRALSVTVTAALTVVTPALPNAQLNQPYSSTLVAAGGVAPYAWSIASGSLPQGLALDATSGVITGTPTRSGNHSFTVRVEDQSSPKQSAEKTLNLRVQ